MRTLRLVFAVLFWLGIVAMLLAAVNGLWLLAGALAGVVLAAFFCGLVVDGLDDYPRHMSKEKPR